VRRPSAALVVACLALAISLSGVSYAAVTLKRNSVGTVHLKRNAVTSTKVKNGTLQKADLRAGLVPSALFTGSIPRGLTLRGTYGLHVPAMGAARHGVSFGVQLASAPVAHYLNAGSPSTTECPGSSTNPQALAGHLCLYEDNVSAAITGRCILSGNGNSCGNAGRWGFIFSGTVAGAVSGHVWGTWAVTSP
jgi:hypothetical protein